MVQAASALGYYEVDMVARITVREVYEDLKAFKDETNKNLASLTADVKWVKRGLFALIALLGGAVLMPALVEGFKVLTQ